MARWVVSLREHQQYIIDHYEECSLELDEIVVEIVHLDLSQWPLEKID